jgi:hypothetical protein
MDVFYLYLLDTNGSLQDLSFGEWNFGDYPFLESRYDKLWIAGILALFGALFLWAVLAFKRRIRER